jgi:hypothetical protein
VDDVSPTLQKMVAESAGEHAAVRDNRTTTSMRAVLAAPFKISTTRKSAFVRSDNALTAHDTALMVVAHCGSNVDTGGKVGGVTGTGVALVLSLFVTANLVRVMASQAMTEALTSDTVKDTDTVLTSALLIGEHNANEDDERLQEVVRVTRTTAVTSIPFALKDCVPDTTETRLKSACNFVETFFMTHDAACISKGFDKSRGIG